MGDRYIIQLSCAYCGKLNEDIYYAESCGSTKFVCEFCKKSNKIKEYFEAEKS